MTRRRADLLLVERGLFDSRARARAAIEAGKVSADGRTVTKASELIEAGAALEAEPAHPWVSRAGLKLDHALNLWPVPVQGRTVLDIGASTGGFTEVCLAHGANKVFAVDVGHDQLHPSLLSDLRVISLEGLDARSLSLAHAPEALDLIVCDASFIGLAKVLPAALALAAPGGDLLCLVKPQFEVGPGKVGKGGVVSDPQARQDALEGVKAWLGAQGWRPLGQTESPITGADGNVEFLLWARRA